MKKDHNKRALIILFFFILLICLLTYLFLRDKTWNSENQVNIGKLTDFITCVGAIATAMTVVYLSLQLKEMIEARISLNFPDLYISNLSFEVQEWQKRPTDLEKIIPTEYKKACIKNVGLGVAKKIEANWEFSKIDLKNYVKDTYAIFESKSDNFKCEILEPKNSIPALYLPSDYLACCGEKLNNVTYQFIKEPTPAKPDLFLNIHYEDAYNNLIKKKFKAEILGVSKTIYISFHEA